MILGCVPLSLVFGIIGIVKDQSKTLAIVVTVLSAGLCLLFLLSSLLSC